MNTIAATYRNGHIIPDEPVDWPEGKRVIIAADEYATLARETDDNQGDDPEAIARWLAEFDAIPALQLTPEEEAEWQAARMTQREFEKATFFQRAEKLRRMFE